MKSGALCGVLTPVCLALALVMSGHAMAASAAEPPAGKHTKTPEQLTEQARIEAKAFRDELAKQVKKGNTDAMIDLATLLEQGDESVPAPTPADRAAALDLFEKAADLHDPFAGQRVCIAYLLGEGRPKNVAKASTYCDPLGVKNPVGLFWAGYTFGHGVGGDADETSAMEIYSRAVDLGSGDAADALGQIALTKKAPEAARKWFRRGTMLGSADAMDHLAVMTETGEGGDANPSEAAWLYGQAAIRGNIHGVAWVKDHPGLPAVPSFLLSSDAGRKIRFLHSYTAKGKPAEETFDFNKIVTLLADNYPGVNGYDTPVNGNATIDCYVDAHRTIDACTIREFPIAYGFGPVLEAFFIGRVSVTGADPDGHPVARTRVVQTVRWLIEQR